MPDFERTTDSWLERHYGGKPKKLAFVDETFSNRLSGVRHPFYAVTAFMIGSAAVATVRAEFARLAGYRKWHTTDRYQERDAEQIRAFSGYVASGPTSLSRLI
ncbi:hypothetical protein [Glaciihabitans sp. UYNi722]|uniref:hypothetical protein n=1 Tax=Glaciihabitans sp. UYNi722 TaxID=3156344 RepID=UPI0033980355